MTQGITFAYMQRDNTDVDNNGLQTMKVKRSLLPLAFGEAAENNDAIVYAIQ